MQSIALVYVFQRLFYRIGDFLRHWYIKSAKKYWTSVIDQLQEIDYTLAWRITLKNLFQPLYGDYSVIGYVLGFLFRGARLVITSAIYLVIFVFAFGVYAAWLAIPPFIIFMAITS